MPRGISEPTCKALLLCSQTIIEQGTGKVSLIGVFNSFFLTTIPGQTSACEAFCQITDAEGDYELRIEVQDLQDNSIIARAEQSHVSIPDRLTTANIIVPVPPLPITRPGIFDFVVFANGNEIDRQSFYVSTQKGDDDGNS
jgi:hypothetical protein